MKIKENDLAPDAMMYYPALPQSYFDGEFSRRKNINNYPELSCEIVVDKDSNLFRYCDEDINDFMDLELSKYLSNDDISKLKIIPYLKNLWNHKKLRGGRYYIKESKIIINGYYNIFEELDQYNYLVLYYGYNDRKCIYNIDDHEFYGLGDWRGIINIYSPLYYSSFSRKDTMFI